MQVTLKKAAALATALSGIKIEVSPVVALSAYSNKDIAVEIDEATSELTSSVGSAMKIVGAVYAIRGLIGTANEGEINELLTVRAMLDKHLSILNAVNNTAKALDYDALKAQRAVLAAQEPNVYGLAKAMNVNIPTGSFVLPLLKKAKKDRLKVEDKLAQLNFTKTIELPEDVVTLLTEHDLI